jgi:hypothetical protein
MTEPAAPVPVQGAQEDVSAVSGEWSGRYWSKETGRRGTIRFSLAEHADTGYGEVEITFSPALSLAEEASGMDRTERVSVDELEPRPCTVIDISIVRVEDGQVRGTMAPYWDPDCNCRAQTVFEGKLSGNRITGSFTTRRASSDRRLLTGKWQVERDRS